MTYTKTKSTMEEMISWLTSMKENGCTHVILEGQLDRMWDRPKLRAEKVKNPEELKQEEILKLKERLNILENL